jgi:uncharacterized repeat protein (TIGR03803 family)
LVTFKGGTNGSAPENQLVQAADGNFYGKTLGYGIYGWGTIYRVTVNGTNGSLTSLISFDGTNGSELYGPPIIDNGAMVQGRDGNLYGMTICGGSTFNSGSESYADGTIFKMTTDGILTTLYSFSGADGIYPVGSLLEGQDGDFYGVTYAGGTYGVGSIFKLSIPMRPVFYPITVCDGKVALSWSAVAGQTYQLQYTTDLISPQWINLGASTLATNSIISTCDVLGSDAQRFYQVSLQP